MRNEPCSEGFSRIVHPIIVTMSPLPPIFLYVSARCVSLSPPLVCVDSKKYMSEAAALLDSRKKRKVEERASPPPSKRSSTGNSSRESPLCPPRPDGLPFVQVVMVICRHGALIGVSVRRVVIERRVRREEYGAGVTAGRERAECLSDTSAKRIRSQGRGEVWYSNSFSNPPPPPPPPFPLSLPFSLPTSHNHPFEGRPALALKMTLE